MDLSADPSQTGYCDAYHLSKSFTKHFAMPPATYRRTIQAVGKT